jgi:hypothetical protein
MAAQFDTLGQAAGVLYGAAGGIFVMIMVAKPTVADMRLARPALTAMSKRAPQGFPTLTWVTLSAGMSMEADARKVAADVTTEFAKHILAEATIIEGSGFQAATVRAIVAGLDAMARSPAPKKTFSAAGPAVDWCVSKRPRDGDTTPAADLAAAISRARNDLTPR